MLVATGTSAQAPVPQAELACAYDGLNAIQKRAVAADYSAGTAEGRMRVGPVLTPLLDSCSARYGWDDSKRRLAGDYAGQRSELEARAATLPAAAPADRLNAIFEDLPEADRRGMGSDAGTDDASFRAIGLRLRERFDAASIPRATQAPAAGYLLALAHLRDIEGAWAEVQRR